MKKIVSYFAVALAAIAACSCENRIEIENATSVKHIIAYADNVSTKTSLSGLDVAWEVGDAITVFDENLTPYHSATLQSSSASSAADFEISDFPKNSGAFAAVYPVDKEATLDSDFDLHTTFPSEQAARLNSFGMGANLSVADTEDSLGEMKFKNIGGLLALTIESSVANQISSVEISAAEAMAGPVLVNLDDFSAIIDEDIDEGSKSVTLYGSFQNGTYYFTVLPGTYSNLHIVFTRNDGYTATYTNSNTLTVARNSNTAIGKITISDSKWTAPQETTIVFDNLGYASWGKDKSFSGTEYDEVEQTKNGVQLTYTRKSGSCYANTSAIRFYKDNDLKFTAPDGYLITSIEWTGSGFRDDVTTDYGDCSSTTEVLSWSGLEPSVTFTRPSSATGYITLSSVKVLLAAGNANEPIMEESITISLNKSLYGIETSGSNGTEQSFTTKEGITVISGCTSNASNKTYYDTSHIRYYASSYLKIGVPDGKLITSVVFTADGTWNGSNGISVNEGTYTDENKTWSGSCQQVEFSFTAQCRVASIAVTVEDGYSVTKYNVSVAEVDGGTLSANPSRAEEGAEITLTATPNEGFEFNNDWVVKDASNNVITVTGGKFNMPASAVSVSGSFSKQTYTITATEAANGTYTVKVGGEDVTYASKGDKVILAATPAGGYLCDGWTVTETVNGATVTVSNNSFTMPAAAVTITTSFSKKPADIEYDHAGTESDPYSIQDVLKYIGTLGTETSQNDVWAKGVISSIEEISTSYGNATYKIKDADTEFEVTVYRGKYIDGAAFTANDQIVVGDEVIVKGKVKNYNGTKEFDTNSQIVSIKKVEVTDAAYKTALFGPNYNNNGVQNYTSTFSSTNNGFTVDVANFNNNNNSWNYIKTGNKTNAAVGTITTNASIDKAITKVVVTIDAITASSVNSITLYSGDSADACTTSEGTFTISTGAQTVEISTPAANKFYKISFDCKKGSSNGLVTVSKVEYYTEK